MRPNFPSQIAQRWVAPFQRYREPSRIFVSFGPCVGSGCCSFPARRRTSRRPEEPQQDRSDLPRLAAYTHSVRRARLSSVTPRSEAANFFVAGVVCRRRVCVLSTVRLTAVALTLSGRDRWQLVTCNRRVRLGARLSGLRLLTHRACVMVRYRKRIGRFIRRYMVFALHASRFCAAASAQLKWRLRELPLTSSRAFPRRHCVQPSARPWGKSKCSKNCPTGEGADDSPGLGEG
jgi:hypothetical protein